MIINQKNQLNNKINGNDLDPYHVTHLFAAVTSFVRDHQCQ